MAATSARPDPWGTLGKLLVALVATAVLTAGLLLPYVGGLGLAAGHEAGKFLDTTCNLQETKPPQKTTLYAKDAKTVIATLFSQDRVPVALDQVPKALQDALVATEDRRFYSHHGVDMRGLLRSAVSTTGGDTQGGSTLTMQYVKQMRYYQAGKDVKKQQAAIDQNLNRKIEDAKCALYIEGTLHESKDQILDNYLNIAFFGENSYGIQTAAGTYFNKPASKLSLPESALLVGLLRAPSEYDPFVHPDAARNRRNEVLQNLVDIGKLSQAEADKDKATSVRLATTAPPVVKEGCANAPGTVKNVAFFCEYAQNWLEQVAGITDLATGGYKIVTTLDAGLQNKAQTRLSTSIPASSPMTAVLPVVDPRTGDVLAMATSKLYGSNKSAKDNTHTTLPVFTAYTAQGASTYKLFALLTALQTGVPSSWPLQTASGYKPRNCTSDHAVTNGDANESYNANETLASATAKSSNTFFVGMADQLFGCDLQPILTTAQRLGMKGLNRPSDDNAKVTVAQQILNTQNATQLVLGDVATSPLEITAAYAAVADDGVYHAAAPILSITDTSGHSVPVKRTPATQAVPPSVARQAVNILTKDTKSPGTSAEPFQSWYSYSQNQSPVAGKTGTVTAVDKNGKDTDKNAALWFVGMTPNLVATSALINFDLPNAPASGLPGESDPGRDAYGAYASKVWLDALQPSLENQQWTWPDPSQAPGAEVPNVSGKTLAEAKSALAADNLRMQLLAPGVQCASGEPIGTVAFYGPHLADAGATITVCPSTGALQDVYTPPVVVVPQPRTGTSHGAPSTKPKPSKPKPSHGPHH